MRQDLEFDAEGVTLRGWLYRPDAASGPLPAIVMAHGFSAVKEMYLDSFAEAFAAAGLGALVFDSRRRWARWSTRTAWPPRLWRPRLLEWFNETGRTRAGVAQRGHAGHCEDAGGPRAGMKSRG
jgi:dienelactone hydrolase